MNLSVKEILWGKTRFFEAASVEEAVELAQRLKSEGQYDWFRGQVLDWPPCSSLHRVNASGDAARKEKTHRRIRMFLQWAPKISELQYLLEAEHVHDVMAILQHYGIPTHYIDFTTDPAVAGFFAANTKKPPSEGQSCIYCLSTNNLKETWNIIKELDTRKGADIEVITIDVRNLWRLQAQQGTFIYANYNWDVDYPLDRILFPYSGYPSYPTHERMYPVDKSPLEQLLDQYFPLENATFVNEELAEMMKLLQERGGSASSTVWETWASGYYQEAFVDGALKAPLNSWSPQALKDWDVSPVENFYETVGARLRLKLKQTIDPAELRKIVSFGVKQILRSEPGIRSRSVDWEFSDLADQDSSEQLNSLFGLAWNGMRRLPFSDAEIADALGSIIALVVTGQASELENQRFSKCFGDCIEVGFSYHDGSGSRGYVSRESLRNALRTDMLDMLSPDYQKYAGDVRELFKIIYNPTLMFEFEEFKRVFAREIIPAQVVLEQLPILFNPARLWIFGIP
jgi:hypothetical protein